MFPIIIKEIEMEYKIVFNIDKKLKKYKTKQLTKIQGMATIKYKAVLTIICLRNLTGIIFVWKNLSPSLVMLVAEKDTPIERNIIRTSKLMPGRTPAPSFSAPT